MLMLRIEHKDDTLYASLSGKLTKDSTYKLEHYIIPYIKKNQIKSMICDCKNLKKIDFEGKYALLKTKMVLKEQQGKLLLCDVKKNIKQGLIGYRMRIL